MNKRFPFTVFPLLLLLLATLLYTPVDATEPYCHENVTVYGYKPVLKTRSITVKPTGIFKFFKKTKIQTEQFEETESYVKEWKLVSKCCEGYRMSALNICEPVCAMGCPVHASCVEPGRCQCHGGYISAISPIDGVHYCEYICKPGYDFYPALDDCLPHCSSGCPHGNCTLPETCECDEGYVPYGGRCRVEDETATDRSVGDSREQTETTTEYTETTLDTTYVSETTTEIPCEEGFIYYRGDCRPALFPSDEFDCHFRPCVENAVCLQNGSCVCSDGFEWETESSLCLQLDEPESPKESEDQSNWWGLTLLVVSVMVLVSVLVFVTFKLLQRQRGHLNVEAKSDLYCEFGKDKDKNCTSQVAVI